MYLYSRSVDLGVVVFVGLDVLAPVLDIVEVIVLAVKIVGLGAVVEDAQLVSNLVAPPANTTAPTPNPAALRKFRREILCFVIPDSFIILRSYPKH